MATPSAASLQEAEGPRLQRLQIDTFTGCAGSMRESARISLRGSLHLLVSGEVPVAPCKIWHCVLTMTAV